jgi:ParB-like chromosome segregation protein Spo0J
MATKAESYQFHSVASIFPLMAEHELEELANDIRSHGLREPIWLHADQIIDGRNRYLACQIAGVEPAYREWDGNGSLVAFVVSLNLHRRHLDTSQRAMVAGRIASFKKGDNQHTQICGTSQDQAAELLNIGIRSVQSAVDVLDHGTPELIDAVEAGHVAVSTAAVLTEFPAEEQREIIARGEAEILKAANQIRAKKKKSRKAEREAAKQRIPDDIPRAGDRFVVIHGRMQDVELDAIDCILTDPPYPEEYLPLFSDLAAQAMRWLKPGGTLAVMSGQAYLPEVFERLSSAGLDYRWTMAYLTPGGQSVQIFPRKVNTFWKPILVFTKGIRHGDWIGDVCRSDVNDNDKRFHGWGQSESGMADLVDRLTLPGQHICDPFMGAGTTGLVAVRMHRIFTGIDIDEFNVKASAARLLEEAANADVVV